MTRKPTMHFGTDTLRLCIPFGNTVPVGQDTLESSKVTCKKCLKALKEEREAEGLAEGYMS
jgi:hypothetical protein